MNKNVDTIKRAVTVFVIVVVLVLLGGLYTTLAKIDEVALDRLYTNQYPDPMPFVVLDPISGIPLMR